MHGFGNAGDGNAGIIFRVHVEVTGPAGSVGRFVACSVGHSVNRGLRLRCRFLLSNYGAFQVN